MKSAGAFESWRVLVCDAAMLPQVLRPGFNHKILDVVAGLRGIREQAPEYRPVTVPDRSQRVHGVSKVCSCSGVDLISALQCLHGGPCQALDSGWNHPPEAQCAGVLASCDRVRLAPGRRKRHRRARGTVVRENQEWPCRLPI
jgi:hypothetical protein